MELPAAEAVSPGGMSPVDFAAAGGGGPQGGAIPTAMPSSGSNWLQSLNQPGAATDALKMITSLAGRGSQTPGVSLSSPPQLGAKLGRGQGMTATSQNIPPVKAGTKGGSGDILKLLSTLLTQGR